MISKTDVNPFSDLTSKEILDILQGTDEQWEKASEEPEYDSRILAHERISREFLENPHIGIKPSIRIDESYTVKKRKNFLIKDMNNGYSHIVEESEEEAKERLDNLYFAYGVRNWHKGGINDKY